VHRVVVYPPGWQVRACKIHGNAVKSHYEAGYEFRCRRYILFTRARHVNLRLSSKRGAFLSSVVVRGPSKRVSDIHESSRTQAESGCTQYASKSEHTKAREWPPASEEMETAISNSIYILRGEATEKIAREFLASE